MFTVMCTKKFNPSLRLELFKQETYANAARMLDTIWNNYPHVNSIWLEHNNKRSPSSFRKR